MALDLCGCISSVFVKALTDFVAMYLISDEREEEGRGRGRGGVVGPSVIFPQLKRLCLCSISSAPSTTLTPSVLALPSLTHLDLSCTRCTPELLNGLATPTIRRVALSLAHHRRLKKATSATCAASQLPHAPRRRDGGASCQRTGGALCSNPQVRQTRLDHCLLGGRRGGHLRVEFTLSIVGLVLDTCPGTNENAY